MVIEESKKHVFLLPLHALRIEYDLLVAVERKTEWVNRSGRWEGGYSRSP